MTHTHRDDTAHLAAKPLEEHLKESMIEGSFGAVVLFDLDHFHQFNLDHGIEQGDKVLALVEEYVRGCGWTGFRLGSDGFGLVVEESTESFDDEEFRGGLQRYLQEGAGARLTLSGGGVWHPGDDFLLDPRMAEIFVSTAYQLLLLAKAAGRDRILWLPRGVVDSLEMMKLLVRYYEDLARISASLARELEIESRVDYLTGLANRRGFEDVFQRMIEGSQRNDTPLALIYMDSDSLKQINDTRGHDAGDRFIVDVARVLNQVVRGSDFISRWGADEFAVLMDNASAERAAVLAGRIQHAVDTRTSGTVSVGVFCGVPATAEEAIQKVDRALYRAKEQGKNRVEFAE